MQIRRRLRRRERRGRMVPILAKQAVIIKCLAGDGIMISNYECAYGVGLLYGLSGIPAPEWGDGTLAQRLEEALISHEKFSFADAAAEHLLKMLRAYKPDKTLDEQIRQLYQMGVLERHPWKRDPA